MSEDKSEAQVKKDIKKYLDSIGAYHFWPVQMGYGERTVDCLACVKGKFFAIEVKRPTGGKLTAKQNETLIKVGEAGGTPILAYNVEDVMAWMYGCS